MTAQSAHGRPALRVPEPARYARILGLGGVRGEYLVPNDDLVAAIDSSDEWIRQRTGIETRARASDEQTIEVLATKSAERALQDAGITAEQIETIILASSTYFVQTPSLATLVADNIGATPAAAFDVSAACAGYCYAIAQADALVRAGTSRYVLVIGAERMGDYVDPADRSISFLLGDGAGAAVIGPSQSPAIGPTVWGSDGEKRDLIRQTSSGLAWREHELHGTELPAWPTLRQEGPSVYKWAVFRVTEYARETIEAAGLRPEDIDVFVPHQANMRIVDHMVKKLGLREDVVVADDIKQTGNTSAASIPLAIERLRREGRVEPGAIALQIGFGAGVVHAAQVVVLP